MDSTRLRNRYYFAYGSNMDRSQMAARCPEAVVVGQGRIIGYRFLINSPGVATIVLRPGSEAHGVLWTITEPDEKSLDRFEGVAMGHYRKETVEVHRSPQSSVKALTYVATENSPGGPREGYIERIVGAAAAHGLPTKYVEELRSWQETGN